MRPGRGVIKHRDPSTHFSKVNINSTEEQCEGIDSPLQVNNIPKVPTKIKSSGVADMMSENRPTRNI